MLVRILLIKYVVNIKTYFVGYSYIFGHDAVRNRSGEIYMEGLRKIMRSLSRCSEGVRVWMDTCQRMNGYGIVFDCTADRRQLCENEP